MKVIRNIALAAIPAVLIATAFVVSSGPAQAAEELDGKAIFLAQKCNMCHAVPSQEIEAKVKLEKMKGPDMDGKLSVGPDEMAKYLRKQSELDGKSHQKEFKGTDEELQTLLDWLGSLGEG